jgi:hypothetical protein
MEMQVEPLGLQVEVPPPGMGVQIWVLSGQTV